MCDCLHRPSSLSSPTPSGLRAAGRFTVRVDGQARVQCGSGGFKSLEVSASVCSLVGRALSDLCYMRLCVSM